ncbi:hypothetical protein HYPSUDRAFT_1002622 [Hypholoma sublateritium FD-334 SS-4]|uniref:Uncharacterized protein n=1 Tax=Hypholoma sublateritium (strain FD-334 SS-4) TaxID=945553 RepID=A0A0D2NFP5_HYPSF|nr:hypothetical protein HYPSUDRAFT_1002622 [Hypholoma sublateritium FD-334 SS-4]
MCLWRKISPKCVFACSPALAQVKISQRHSISTCTAPDIQRAVYICIHAPLPRAARHRSVCMRTWRGITSRCVS